MMTITTENICPSLDRSKYKDFISQEHIFLKLIEHLPIGLMLIKGKEILFQNKLIREHLDSQISALIQEKLSNLETKTSQEKIIKNTREGKYILCNCVNIQNDCFAVITKDITKITKIKENFDHFVEIETEKRLAEERLILMGKILAEIIHEINTPATFMKTNIQVFKAYLKALKRFINEFEFSETDKKRIDKLLKESSEIASSLELGIERIIQLVKSVKSLGKREKEIKKVDLGEALKEALFLTYNRTKKYLKIFVNGIPFELKRFSWSFKIKLQASKGALVQMIIIIINNAVEIARERKIKGAWLKIDVSNKGKLLKLTFQDNCGGVPPGQIDRLFEQFYTTKEEGSGLGLYILKELTKSLGAHLKAQNIDNPRGFKISILLENSEQAYLE